MRINTNMAALNAWRNLSANGGKMEKSLEKLSSGFRINRAADDAAGLAVSEKMRAQIRGTNMAVKNSQDGISLLQTAEGGLQETHSILQRMRELAVQSSTSTLQDADRTLLQEEFSQLQTEITRISTSTKFNGKTLLDGSSGFSATVSAGTASSVSGTGETAGGTYSYTSATVAAVGSVWISDVNTGVLASAADTFTVTQTISVNGKDYAVTAATTTAQNLIDAINADSTETGVTASFDTDAVKISTNDTGSAASVTASTSLAVTDFGLGATNAEATTTTLSLAENVGDTGSDATLTGGNLGSATYSAVGDVVTVTDGTAEGLSFTVNDTATASIVVGTNGTMDIQTGSDAGQTLSISISNMSATALSVNSLSVATQSGSSTAITSIDAAINTVSTERAELGALQNRLEHTVSSLTTTSENLSAAESRIRDVDMAAEMSNFTKYQILSQASTAMLAQANQATQGVLSLLR